MKGLQVQNTSAKWGLVATSSGALKTPHRCILPEIIGTGSCKRGRVGKNITRLIAGQNPAAIPAVGTTYGKLGMKKGNHFMIAFF